MKLVQKQLIQKFLYPSQQNVWVGVPIGFIVRASVYIGGVFWFIDGKKQDTEGSQATFEHTFLTSGQHTVRARVFDGEGGYDDSGEKMFIVEDQPSCPEDCTCSFTQTKSAILVDSSDNTVGFTVNLSPYGEKVQSVHWNWGDGKSLDAPTEADVLRKNAQGPSYKYAQEGEFYGNVEIKTVTKSWSRNFFVIVG